MSHENCIPDGLVIFETVSGASFRLDLLEAVAEANRIGTVCAAEGVGNFEYARRFGAWVLAQAGVTLTTGEADFLFDRVRVLYAAQKKTRLDPLLGGDSSPTLPSSSASTPAC